MENSTLEQQKSIDEYSTRHAKPSACMHGMLINPSIDFKILSIEFRPDFFMRTHPLSQQV